MKYVWNYVLMSWLFVKFYVVSFTPAQLEHTSVVDINRNPSSVFCPGDALITILNISVKNGEYCDSEPCTINDGDREVFRRLCDNSTSCLIDGSDLSTACLLEHRRFNLSYFCEAPISLHCNFDNDLLCTLDQEENDDFDWTRNSGDTDSPDTGPDADHTTNSDHGFYMYIEATDKRKRKKAKLMSKSIDCKNVQCLTFWYHMYGVDIGSLSVYLIQGREKKNIWRKNGIDDDEWKFASVNLNCTESFQIEIEGKIKNSDQTEQGDIALDDVFVFGGSCQKTSKLICDFEQQQSCTLHNTHDPSADLDYIYWNVVQGSETTNGPATDHSIKSGNGFYFHLEAFESPGKGRLDSESIRFAGIYCFTIWYYIIGNIANTLTVQIMSGGDIRHILTIHGHSVEKWEKMAVSVDIVYSDKIIIDGILKQHGSISFDDMSISEGACIEDEEYNDSCLSINNQHKIEKCATLYFQKEGLDIALYPSLSNSNNEKECTNKKNEIEKTLKQFCIDNYFYNICKFEMKSLILDYNKCFTFKKRISITFLCTEEQTTVTVSSDSTTADSSAAVDTTHVSSFTASREASSAVSDTVSDEGVTLPKTMRISSESASGLVAGLVIGALLLLCVAIMIIVIIRRHIKSNPGENIRNNLGENDYIGSQDIALPLTSNDSRHIYTATYDGNRDTSVTGHDSKNANAHINNTLHAYTNVGAGNGFLNKKTVQVPTYAHRQDKTFADNHISNDDEYATVDSTAETRFNETTDNRTGTAGSYMVLDPTQTGFNRQLFSNTPVDYEFAHAIKDSENQIIDDDQYAGSDGVYDHSGNNRHKELEDNIYNQAVDTIYDSCGHKRINDGREDTYDHFFGQTTEDDYNISTTT